MKVDLTIQEYAHLRAIYELDGKCDGNSLRCSECPLKFGIDVDHRSYVSKACVPEELRKKIAMDILSFDKDIRERIVEDKI